MILNWLFGARLVVMVILTWLNLSRSDDVAFSYDDSVYMYGNEHPLDFFEYGVDFTLRSLQ
jgi:hypothetical protein